MPCKDAILPNPIVGHTGQTVQELLALLEDKHIRTLPVVDENGKMVGLFGFEVILKNLLPVSATMEDGLQRLDFIVGAAPGSAKRLRKLYPQKVEEVMQTDCKVVHSDTPTWEAVRLVLKYGSPIPVVDDAGKLVGIITEQSLLADFKKILAEIEQEGTIDEAC